MTTVNRSYPDIELHASLLMGLLFREVRAAFAAEDWEGLRQSHFRVVSGVPPEGISVTDLGERVGMTKQGMGQFVTQLVDTGHLSVGEDPADRRVRVVRRTPRGERLVADVTARNLRIEKEWATRVGEDRYQVFRQVLEELAQPGRA
ncbi:MAG: MarR family transcriptional regulator [Nocardioidaceae bacterium]|nr:MarR family transcriptional regulator [Nocardioidaceae bacterium]